MVESDEIAFTWGADAGSGNARKRLFSPVVASPDNGCDGMYFLRYYANGKPNVFLRTEKKKLKILIMWGPSCSGMKPHICFIRTIYWIQ